ncbi:hypothetical protein CGRA01v4_14712 [Colletotrichum graminicola]|nr:hypothetical protein CGRA01v4_14712 [Colletotrichum graminicola]
MSRPCINVCSSPQGNPSSPPNKAQPCIALEFSFPPISMIRHNQPFPPLPSPPSSLRQITTNVLQCPSFFSVASAGLPLRQGKERKKKTANSHAALMPPPSSLTWAD